MSLIIDKAFFFFFFFFENRIVVRQLRVVSFRFHVSETMNIRPEDNGYGTGIAESSSMMDHEVEEGRAAEERALANP